MQTQRYLTFVIAVLWSSFSALGQSVVINEVMASNKTVLADEDGDFSDWIELHNPNAVAVDLTGLSLSDNRDSLHLWAFPSTLLMPGEFRVIFCSLKNRTGAEWHTNFSIKAAGEAVYLSDGTGSVLDSFPASRTLPNRSIGRATDANPVWFSFLKATPGTSNHESTAPAFSRLGGYFEDDEILVLQHWMAGDEIRFTADGTEPTATSHLYDSAVHLSSYLSSQNPQSLIPTSYFWEEPQADNLNSVIVKAAIFRNDSALGGTVTTCFFHHSAQNPALTVPIISIITDARNLFDHDSGLFVPGAQYDFNDPDWTGNFFSRGEAWERDAYFEFLESDGSIAVSQEVGIKVHGAKRRREPQKSIRILAREEYGINKIYHDVFPERDIDEFKRLILRSRSATTSGALINDFLAHRIVDGEIKVMNQAMRTAIVYVNGEYFGIEDIAEKQDRFFLESYTGIDRDSFYVVDGYTPTVVEGGHPARLAFLEMADYIQDHDLSITANYEHVKTILDIENFIDYHFTEIFMANVDWPGNNLKMWRPAAGGKWQWLLYDLDIAMLLVYEHTLAHATMAGGTDWPNYDNSTIFLRKLLLNESFKRQFFTRAEVLLNTVFHPETVNAKIDQIYREYAPEIDKHIDRWGYPESFTRWDREVKEMKKFIRLRPCVVRHWLLDDYQYVINADGCNDWRLNITNMLAVPNPSNGQFTLHFNISEPAALNLNVLDMTGRLLHVEEVRAEIDDNEYTLDLSYLTPGVYLVRLESEERMFSTRIVISE